MFRASAAQHIKLLHMKEDDDVVIVAEDDNDDTHDFWQFLISSSFAVSFSFAKQAATH